MALSMDEQRMLAEIERRLAAEDPGLAARMSSFRRPGPANIFRSARARVIGSLLTVVIVAIVSLLVYAMVPFRSSSTRTLGGHPAASRGLPVMTVSGAGGTRAGTSQAGTAKTGAPKTGTAKANGTNAARPAAGTTTRRSAASHASSAARTASSASAARPASTTHGP